MNVGTFCTIIHALCKIYGGSVTSWTRSIAHNKGIPGSVANSKHLDGLAVDVVLDDVENQTPFIAACRALKIRAFWDRDHVHAEAL